MEPNTGTWRYLALAGTALQILGIFLPALRIATESVSLWKADTASGSGSFLTTISVFLIVLALVSALLAATKRPGGLWLTASFSVATVSVLAIGFLEIPEKVHLGVGGYGLLVGVVLLTVAAVKGEPEITHISSANPPPQSPAWLLPTNASFGRAIGGLLTLGDGRVSFAIGSAAVFDVPLPEVTDVSVRAPLWFPRRFGSVLSLNIQKRRYLFGFCRPWNVAEGLASFVELLGERAAGHFLFHLFGIWFPSLQERFEERALEVERTRDELTAARHATGDIANEWCKALGTPTSSAASDTAPPDFAPAPSQHAAGDHTLSHHRSATGRSLFNPSLRLRLVAMLDVDNPRFLMTVGVVAVVGLVVTVALWLYLTATSPSDSSAARDTKSSGKTLRPDSERAAESTPGVRGTRWRFDDGGTTLEFDPDNRLYLLPLLVIHRPKQLWGEDEAVRKLREWKEIDRSLVGTWVQSGDTLKFNMSGINASSVEGSPAPVDDYDMVIQGDHMTGTKSSKGAPIFGVHVSLTKIGEPFNFTSGSASDTRSSSENFPRPPDSRPSSTENTSEAVPSIQSTKWAFSMGTTLYFSPSGQLFMSDDPHPVGTWHQSGNRVKFSYIFLDYEMVIREDQMTGTDVTGHPASLSRVDASGRDSNAAKSEVVVPKGDSDHAIQDSGTREEINKILAMSGDTLIREIDNECGVGVYFEFRLTLSCSCDAAKAVSRYRQALTLSPRSAEGHEHLGLVLAKTGDYDAAVAEYKEAIKLDPAHPRYHQGLANVFEFAGNIQAAEQELAALVQQHPRDATVLVDLAELETTKGNLSRAREYYGRACQAQWPP